MKPVLWLLLLLLLPGCERLFFSGPQLRFMEDDFGPPGITASWLGPRTGGVVIVHHGPTHHFNGTRHLNITAAMHRLRASARHLPPGDPARQRMSATYGRMYDFYRTRRDAVMATPYPAYGRGGLNRAAMMPLMPLTL